MGDSYERVSLGFDAILFTRYCILDSKFTVFIFDAGHSYMVNIDCIRVYRL